MQILLSWTQAGAGRTGKQEQEQTSRNHVQAFLPISVFAQAATAIIETLKSQFGFREITGFLFSYTERGPVIN